VDADAFALADELGPARIIHVTEPTIGLRGILVVDNVAIGPSIGGLRMAPDVTLEECFRLARAMTLKNAAAGLPHGGGKSVLRADPSREATQKERLIRGMAYTLRHEQGYIFGPDMGTDERCMAWIKDEIGQSVGLPRELGGIPLDEIGATGWGMRHATEIALPMLGIDISGVRIAVQGFGAVGRHYARFLHDLGAVLVAASDTGGTLYGRGGLDVDELIGLKRAGRSVTDALAGERLSGDAIIDVDCEIWVPAARPDVVTRANVDRLSARLVVEGANIPLTDEAERILHQRGVMVLPDFIANAGGVICAAMEYHGATEGEVFATIAEKIRANTDEMLTTSRREQTTPREAALRLAVGRVTRAMQTRRWSLL